MKHNRSCGVSQMMVVLNHKEMSYVVVGLFDNLVAPLLYLYL